MAERTNSDLMRRILNHLRSDKPAAASSTAVAQYPVGWCLLSFVNINPATFLGYGTWVAAGAGRVLVGLDAGDADFNVVEKTGGEKSRGSLKHSGAGVSDHPPLTHSGCTVTQHPATNTGPASAGATKRGSTASTLTLGVHTHQLPALSHSVLQASQHPTQQHEAIQADEHPAISVLQPYLVAYIWKRVA